MSKWHPQQFEAIGKSQNISSEILENSIATAKQILDINPDLPPIFSLKHLAHLSNCDYGFLRAVASRKSDQTYRSFRLAKGDPSKNARGFRIIKVPTPELMKVQRWLSKNVLSNTKPHYASFAYHKDSKIKNAAILHCEAQWQIKLDVRNFFESISEIGAYRVFRKIGYQPLVSFEFARICTAPRELKYKNRITKKNQANVSKYKTIDAYQNKFLGYLPQGAPTSPMISNLFMKEFDEDLIQIAKKYNLTYTRYADDLCLTTKSKEFNRKIAAEVIRKIYSAMNVYGLMPNIAKARVIPPGSRKVLLGLLIDSAQPKLTREFRMRLRMHLYYLTNPKIGPALHASKRGFVSVWGLRNHIEGLISYARQIDPNLADVYQNKLKSVNWPL